MKWTKETLAKFGRTHIWLTVIAQLYTRRLDNPKLDKASIEEYEANDCILELILNEGDSYGTMDSRQVFLNLTVAGVNEAIKARILGEIAHFYIREMVEIEPYLLDRHKYADIAI